MTNKVLLKFAKKGINLSPDAYEKIINSDNPINLSSSLIVKLKSNKYELKDLISVDGKIIDELMGNEKKPEEKAPENKKMESQEGAGEKKTIEEFKKASDEEKKPKTLPTNSEKVIDEKIEFKRNLEKTNVEYDFEIIQDTSKKSYTTGEIGDLIQYFQSRYEKLYKILSSRPELKLNTKIADIDEAQSTINIIAMVKEIRSTKNGHKIVEFEDDTGSISILFSNKNEELFHKAEKLVKDEVVGIITSQYENQNSRFNNNEEEKDKEEPKEIEKLVTDDDNSSKSKRGNKNKSKNFGYSANDLIFPGVTRIPEKEMDFGIVFLSDVHIGSLTFLENAFQNFIDWINCEFGSEEQRKVAENVKYLVIGGDLVDGVGVYPNQDKELSISDVRLQYKEAARFLGNIRSDIKIIIAPGNHDPCRLAEPQPAVPEEFAKELYELDNVEFVSNPAVVSLDGIEVLIYHGESFNELVMAVKDFTLEKNELIMEELLNKRHVAPIYGERTPLASELEDYLVIERVPDIFHTGHVHINTHKKYKGIHLINSGTFQTQTEYQKIYNIEPTPAEVPIINNGKYLIYKFID